MSSSKHRSALSASPQQRLLWRLANATGTTGAAQRAGVLQPITPSDPGFFGALEALGTVTGDDEPFERFGLALAMAPLAPGNIQQTLEQRKAEAHLFLGARRAGLLALRRAAAPGIASFLDDGDPRLALEAARAIHDVPIPQAYPALAALLDSPTIHAWGRKHAFELQTPGALQQAPAVPTNAATLRPARDQVLFRALNAHFRLGQATNALALAQFAAQPTPPGFEAQDSTELRAEALFLLGAWEVLPAEPGRVPVFPTADPNHGAVPTVNPENWPGWFDRIVGVWRPLPPRSSDAARDALEPRIEAMISETNTALALAATDTAVRLKLARAGETLLARLKHPHTDGLLRRRVTSALAQLGSPRLAEALPIALADPDPELQAAALPYLNRLEGGQAVPLLAEKLRTATATTTPTPAHIRLGQAALAALGRIESPEAIPPLLEALDRLLAGPFPPALELDLLEAARRKSAEAITSRLARRDASLPAGDPLASWRETLFGGDATRGRAVFLERPEVQCSRCHKLGTEGGIVGPALDGIAKQRDRRYLLESIVQPNAQIAQGFDNVLVTLRDDREFAGTVRSETDDTLVLATVEAGEVKLPKTSIADRRRGLSAMPDGLAALVSRRDLRDLIEFLASLKN
jgi:putative heme-binding domain-containing protein